MKRRISTILVGFILILALIGVAGCSKKDNDTAQGENTQSGNTQSGNTQDATSQSKTKIVIATSGSPAPYLYTDDKGNLDGYDVAVMNEIFSRLPQYEVTYELTEFASIFAGLDAGFYQVGLNHMGYNHDRGEKYIYSDLYGQDQYGILVRDDNTDIKTVADFAGHSTEVTASSKNATIFESYNAANSDKQIILQYTENANAVKGVTEGTSDFYFFQITTLKAQADAIGATNVKIIPVPNEDAQSLTNSPIGNFVLFPKGYEQLAEDFNKALREAVEDGSVQKLRKEYLGVDDTDVLTIADVDLARDFINKDLSQ